MVLIGTWLAIALAIVGYGAWWLLRVRKMPIGNWIGVVALAVWLAGVSIAWLLEGDESSRVSSRLQAFDSLAWPETTEPPRTPAAVAAGNAGVQAAPVESLVTRLETRLAAQPDDAEGWTLLAQSYAYTANEEALERAVRRAVELGVDEAMLRARVASAKRSAHPVDWFEQVIGPAR